MNAADERESRSVPTATVELARGRERAPLGGHPWVMSGSVARIVGSPAPGDLVQVVAADGRPIGLGDYDPGSQIRVRLLGLPEATAELPEGWLEERLSSALAAREQNPALAGTNALRLVHAEADHLPGLTLDRFADWVVLKPSTPAMLARVERISQLLASRLELSGIWLRGEVTGGVRIQPRVAFGEVPSEPVEIYEGATAEAGQVAGGRRFLVDLRHGQKTGFYLDQRDSRALFQQLAPGRQALDLYAYTGGFSVAAAAGHAARTLAVESSAGACELLQKNAPAAEIVHGDVQEFLSTSREHFDLISIDPPPFAKHKRDVDAACRAYRELHTRAFARAARGAHVLTFTCSHHVQPAIFRRTVAIAARSAKREVRMLRALGAPPDHPVSLHHAEGEYLSGLWLQVADAPQG